MPSDDPATRAATAPFTAESFPAEPELECDIVMKGGITSGVIYPLAVCELAQTYRLRSVGGASAGAIAAAAAAAAEVGRATAAARADVEAPAAGTLPPGFLGFTQFPTLLTQGQADGKSLLFHLFRPQPETRPLFELLTAAMDEVATLPKPARPLDVVKLAARLLRRAALRSGRRAVIGILPGAVLAVLGLVGVVATLSAIGIVLSIVMILVGIVTAVLGLIIAVMTALLDDLKRLPAVGFGISSGRGESDTEVALTPWLYQRLQELAGKPDKPPLTFGDLRQHGIDFQAMTTNLSRAEPMAMPWSDDAYFFEPTEFEKLFGKEIVEFMERNPPPLPSAPSKRRAREVLLRHAGTKRPLPRPEQLPIIVATRMSLSFPLLISAVPLYTVDYTRSVNCQYSERVSAWRRANPDGSVEDHARAVPAPEFDVNWFSDGGLTANLPVQFFDSPLPTRPTFAIDLASFSADHPQSADERENSYLPRVNQGGLHRRTARWKPEPISQLVSFGLSLIQTARTWVDEASLVMPGYRDRVVTVYTGGKEGGLNLSMAADVVEHLSTRGRFAAQRLVQRFGADDSGWANHRWVRFRAATAGLSEWLTAFEAGFSTPTKAPYDPILARQEPQPSYPMTVGRLAAAQSRITALRIQIGQWGQDPADAFTKGRPNQPPVLRLVPRNRPVEDDS
jgi:predicted acylesterase/phospholipase RssA